MREYAQNRIRDVRKLRKMSMEALGAAINPSVTHNTIAKLERREMGLTLDYLLEIARVLRVHPSEILPAVGWEESPLNSNIVFVLNGPNLNLLGTREPEIYGSQTLADIEAMLVAQAAPLGLAIDLRQSNHEGTLVDWLHEAQAAGARAVLLNAGGYTHTSIALHDAIKSIKTPVIEVHLSDPHTREAFRHISYVGMAAVACFAGHGARSYTLALDAAAAL